MRLTATVVVGSVVELAAGALILLVELDVEGLEAVVAGVVVVDNDVVLPGAVLVGVVVEEGIEEVDVLVVDELLVVGLLVDVGAPVVVVC